MCLSSVKKRVCLHVEEKKKDRRGQAGRLSPESRTNPKVGRKWLFFFLEEHIKPNVKIQCNVNLRGRSMI